MNKPTPEIWALDALGALAHETRLRVFRLLITAGPDGLIAGMIAERLNVPPSTMSHHLSGLERAGLVHSRRESRLIHYKADYTAMKQLILFLIEDCCGNQTDLCGDIISAFNCKTPASII